MKVKYYKCYLMIYSGEKDIDYWLLQTWVGYGRYESCVEIPRSLSRANNHRRWSEMTDMTNFFLLTMNKKRDAVDQYKLMGRDRMIDLEY